MPSLRKKYWAESSDLAVIPFFDFRAIFRFYRSRLEISQLRQHHRIARSILRRNPFGIEFNSKIDEMTFNVAEGTLITILKNSKIDKSMNELFWTFSYSL